MKSSTEHVHNVIKEKVLNILNLDTKAKGFVKESWYNNRNLSITDMNNIKTKFSKKESSLFFVMLEGVSYEDALKLTHKQRLTYIFLFRKK